MDLASIYYLLGIVFFITVFIMMIVGAVMAYQTYHKIETFKKQAPMQVVSYLQDHNSEGMKALGITLVGFVMNMIKNKLRNKS
ncbi:MAG: hypothetical protein WCO78_05025 [Candidatus Roizmanbacteria bacterium]